MIGEPLRLDDIGDRVFQRVAGQQDLLCRQEEDGPIEAVNVEVAQYANSDDAQLELLGYKPEFKRDFSFLGLYSLVSSELAVLPGVAGTIWCVVRATLPRHS